MQPYQERVINEKEKLEDDWNALDSFLVDAHIFMDSPLSEEEMERLNRQHGIMLQLIGVLKERIAAFN